MLLQLTLLQDLLLELLIQLLELLQLGQLLAVLLEGSLQLALLALVIGIGVGATVVVLLVVDNLSAGLGLGPLRGRQVGQVGHISHG